MAPFKQFFGSRKPVMNGVVSNNENGHVQDTSDPYGRVKPSVALHVKEKRDEPNEFKLSSVNDSGEYLPPSPVEQRSFWGPKSPSTTSTARRSVFSDNEPFSISRESFDSYRRSFDISGRSPIIHSDSYNSRASMDSRRLPRPAITNATFDRLPNVEAEDAKFEDVGLNDDREKQQPKKKGFLARFGESHGTNTSDDGKHHFSIMSGRKRGQSGTGSELNNMPGAEANSASKGQIGVTS